MAKKGGKKKKGSGKLASKLSKMTEEERILYQEQQRLAAEEVAKKKQDMLTQFLKDKLNKEEKASRFNVNKLNHQWRNIMREIKSRDLKKDIEILSQTFERVVDRKESVIKSLAKDLMEAEQQYSMALRSHLRNVDNLIGVHRQRLATLQQAYNGELNVIRAEFDTERSLIVEQCNREMNELQDIIYGMEQNVIDRENDAKSDYQSLRDEIKNKNLEEKHALRVQLESAVENLWQQFQAALKNYNETTEERKKSFEALKIKDEASAAEIETQMRKLQRIADNIALIKSKMAANTKECEERNRSLKAEREYMATHFQSLKGQMNELRENERAALAKLVIESEGCLKELKRTSGKGEHILKLVEMCRKLQTEEEKVIPFYITSLTEQEQSDINAAVHDAPAEALACVLDSYLDMENFWKRFNKSLLDKVALDKEKQVLLEENHQLRNLLKQYLDGISVNDEILSQVNPLFVVNEKTNVQLNVPVVDRRIRRPAQTIVEAAHVVRHVLL